MMKKRHILILVVIGITAGVLFAQENYKEQYLELLRNNQFDELKNLLGKWEKAEPKNPEMFIGFFNYFSRLGAAEKSVMGQMPDGRFGVYHKMDFNKENVYKGIKYLDKGLTINPNRLDMYWGKIEILFEIEDYKTVGDTLKKLIEISPNYNNSWLLGGGKSVNDGENYFIDYINRYYNRLLNSSSDDAAGALVKCTEQQIKTYPKSAYAPNTLAIYYVYQEKYDEALKYFLSAEEIDCTDCLVLINIGRLYATIKNNTKAKEYFNKVLEIGKTEEKEQAKYFIAQFQL
jgi:tetratricopeptide (TPR) repeat protein